MPTVIASTLYFKEGRESKVSFPVRSEVLLSDDDRIQVLAFQKFLKNSEWVKDNSFSKGKSKRRILLVEQRDYDYATGKINAREYLGEDLSANSNQLRIEFEDIFSSIGED